MEKETKHTPDLYLIVSPGKIHLRDRNNGNKSYIDVEDWHQGPEIIAKLELIVTAVNSYASLQTELSEMKAENERLKSEIMRQGDTIVSLGKVLLKPSEKEELSEMKKENARLKSELLHRDVTVLPQKDLEFEEMKASLQSEIDRLNQENEELKDNYEGMTSHCKYLTEINVFNMAFDKADEHWRKAHKVEEGENFIDWYLRYQAAEREADRKQLSEMKKEREELVKALERIYNPIKWMQDNLQPGEVINGQTAVQLSDSASYLKSIAYSTLSRIKK